MGLVNPHYSIIIPVYNGASVLPVLMNHFKAFSVPSAKIVLVDDGSRDESWDIICHCVRHNTSGAFRVKGIRLDKNRGQQSAILAALTICRDEPVVTMDDDGSHPLQVIPQLLRALENGNQLAYALPSGRPGSMIRRFFSRLHQVHMSLITGTSLSIRVGSYRAISPELIRRILAQPLIFPYISSQALSLRPAPSVEMVESPQFFGKSKKRSRFSIFGLLTLECRLTFSCGPFGKLRRQWLSILKKHVPAGETAASWIAEITER